MSMNADQVLSFADSLRAHARRSGFDINESNLFVHSMLMQAVQKERGKDRIRDERERLRDPRLS